MTDVTSIAHRSEVAQTRRGYALLGLGLILPGSAQAIQGPRRLGRFALELWIVLVLVAVLTIVLTLLFRNAMLAVFGTGWVLKVLAIGIFAVGGLWTCLGVHTWWLARPWRMGAKKSAVFSAIALLLVVALAVATMGFGRAAWATGGAFSNIFSGGGNSQQNQGRFNILLLGSDAGPDREGVRPDSINLVSVDAATGRTVIFGLPRNLERVPFPESSPMHALYPNGYGCGTHECLLNAVYLLGQEHANIYPNVANPGIQATIEAVSGVTGLDINYYAMINMQGFADLIDAMGGLTITLHQRIKIMPTDDYWLEPGPDQHLDGNQVLMFARARYETSDYDRMQRQRCVMAAMLSQLNPNVVASKFTELATASGTIATTSVPPSQIGALADLALKAKSLPITSLSFTPPLVNTGDPDYPKIRQYVADTIAQSKALDDPKQSSQSNNPPPAQATGDSQPPTNADPPLTQDLDQVCSVR